MTETTGLGQEIATDPNEAKERTLETINSIYELEEGNSDLPIQQFFDYLTNSQATVQIKVSGSDHNVPLSDVFQQNQSLQNSMQEAFQILTMLLDGNQKVEPTEDMFFVINDEGQRIPKFSHFTWESFGNHTSWCDIVNHIIRTPLTGIHTKAQVLKMLQLRAGQ